MGTERECSKGTVGAYKFNLERGNGLSSSLTMAEEAKDVADDDGCLDRC